MISTFDIAEMIAPHLPKGGHGWIFNVVQNLEYLGHAPATPFERVITQTRNTYDPLMSTSPVDQKWNA